MTGRTSGSHTSSLSWARSSRRVSRPRLAKIRPSGWRSSAPGCRSRRPRRRLRSRHRSTRLSASCCAFSCGATSPGAQGDADLPRCRQRRASTAKLSPHSGRQFAGDLRDFAETAALVEHMDVVVTVDTSVAHLAGAMGKPTWILLPFNPDWRWTLDREDSPWYPTARLFRQPAIGDWASVIIRVRDELARHFGVS